MTPKNPYNAVSDVVKGAYRAEETRRKITAFEAIQVAQRKRMDMMYAALAMATRPVSYGTESARPIYKQSVESGIYQSSGGRLGDGLGKITDYGQTDDPDWDSLTAAGKSAIGNIIPGKSMALSRDVEAAIAKKGVKIGDEVEVALSDGTVLRRIFDDRTAAVYKGKTLTGRIDLHTPQGQSPYRDARVLDIRPISTP